MSVQAQSQRAREIPIYIVAKDTPATEKARKTTTQSQGASQQEKRQPGMTRNIRKQGCSKPPGPSCRILAVERHEAGHARPGPGLECQHTSRKKLGGIRTATPPPPA